MEIQSGDVKIDDTKSAISKVGDFNTCSIDLYQNIYLYLLWGIISISSQFYGSKFYVLLKIQKAQKYSIQIFLIFIFTKFEDVF